MPVPSTDNFMSKKLTTPLGNVTTVKFKLGSKLLNLAKTADRKFLSKQECYGQYSEMLNLKYIIL
jgi:hypothetical protein